MGEPARVSFLSPVLLQELLLANDFLSFARISRHDLLEAKSPEDLGSGTTTNGPRSGALGSWELVEVVEWRHSVEVITIRLLWSDMMRLGCWLLGEFC